MKRLQYSVFFGEWESNGGTAKRLFHFVPRDCWLKRLQLGVRLLCLAAGFGSFAGAGCVRRNAYLLINI